METKAITENIDDILKSNDVQAKIGSKDVSSQEMSERYDRRCHTESKEKDGSDMMDSETLDKVESSIEQNPETSVEVLVDNKMDQTTEVEALALIAISDKEKDLYGAKVADSQFTDWEETIDKSMNKAIEIPKEDTMAQTTIDEIKSEEISDPGIKEIEYTKAKESGTADADVIRGSNVNEDKLSQSQLEKESTQENFSASERNKWDTFKETQAKTLSGDDKEYIKETPEDSTSSEEKLLESSEKDVLLETQEKSLSSKDKKSESSGKTESSKATVSDGNIDLACQEKSDADDIENQEKFKLNVGSQEETMANEQKLAECKETVEFPELRTVEQQEAMESTNDEIPEAQGINEPGDNHDKHIEIDKNVATDGDILESRCVINSFDDNNMKLQETRDKYTDSHKVEKIIKAADARKDGDHILKLQEKSDEVVDSVEIITRETKDDKTIESADDNKETANDTIKSSQIEEAPVRGDEEIDRIGNEGTSSGKIETENVSEECPEVKAVVIKEEIPDGFESTEVSESNKTESITKTTSTTPLGTTEPEVIVILDDDEDSQRSRQCFDMPLLDSDESSESRNIRLRTKPCKILIRKLRPSDLVNLRQPKVRVKRVKIPDFFQEQFKSKRRRFERKGVYITDNK